MNAPPGTIHAAYVIAATSSTTGANQYVSYGGFCVNPALAIMYSSLETVTMALQSIMQGDYLQVPKGHVLWVSRVFFQGKPG